jgi:hypothetical protein
MINKNDTAVRSLEKFKNSLHSPSAAKSHLDIRFDIASLVEVQDIIDELGILRMVLKDQKNTVDEMKKIFASKGSARWDENKVAASHEHRIETMERISKDTKQSVVAPHQINLDSPFVNSVVEADRCPTIAHTSPRPQTEASQHCRGAFCDQSGSNVHKNTGHYG